MIASSYRLLYQRLQQRAWGRLSGTIFGFACALCLPAAFAAEQPAMAENGVLVVTLSGMKSDDGSLVYAMWSGPEGWLETNTVREGFVAISDGASQIRFENLPYGEYGISVYHDLNDNRKLDTGFFRVPREPFGFSNEPKLRFGPPKYEDAAFMLNQPEQTIHIPVRKLFE